MTQTIIVANPRSVLQSPHPLRIIALGDSLVYGYGDPVGGGWVERLRRLWLSSDGPGHIIYNLGVRGNGVAQVQERLEYEFRQRGELRNRYPDLIILSVGVNDSSRLGHRDGRLFTDLENFKVQIAELVDRAKQLCPVLFVGMVPVDESKMPFLNCLYYNHADQYFYKEATRIACETRQIPYLDVFDLWQNREESWMRSHMSGDGLHPNVEGYQALLQDILNWQAILKLGLVN